MTDAENDLRLQEAIARSEIQQVLARYCRGVDRGDAALIGSVFHDDAAIQLGAFTTTGAQVGPVLAAKQLEKYQAALHHLTTSLIEIEGDQAAAETYFQASFLVDINGVETIIDSHGRYIDRFERRQGEWRISARTSATAWAEMRPANGMSNLAGPQSLRNRDDLSYRNFDFTGDK